MGIFKQTAEESKKEQIRDAMVYNIWLAGLGAYAKSADEVNQLSDKGKSLFDELIERGRAVESKTKERVHTARSHTSVAIEERVHTMVQKLIGIDNERLDRVDDKIDQLTSNIEALLARQQEAAKPAAKKTTAKSADKPATTRTRKPSVARRKPVKAATPVPKKEPEAEKKTASEPVKPKAVAAKPVEEKKPATEA
ncbi:phasin family protein [Photobacterium sp. OFAV2-7]|uniref:phasin-related domain-containing protein n=1 Tax=Photobacterium sp. OFAV2-7 TaxID=2917748 RepID=UPI001EF431E9|nr:phasin family protein [Photobacterium sp. OFAV2-7]MCG7588312.1 phasin family protein [Photobacterium sp. OFAV2-7]